MAIVGYDDIAFAAAAAVPLSSVRQPRLAIGYRAAELLFDEIEALDGRNLTITSRCVLHPNWWYVAQAPRAVIFPNYWR
jgi:DNA-binding LacI/PurR family transcriptional regulator